MNQLSEILIHVKEYCDKVEIEISTSNRNYQNWKYYYQFKSNIDIDYQVHESDISGVYLIYQGVKLISKVGYSGSYEHSDYMIVREPKYSSRYIGHPDGVLESNNADEIFLDGEKVGHIESGGLFNPNFIDDLCEKKTFKLFYQWEKIVFDQNKLSIENALAFLFMNHGRIYN